MLSQHKLFAKYNVPVPRYTSYPAVPHWKKEEFDPAAWLGMVSEAFRCRGEKDGISLYIHLPFCESLCTYCGCNTRITVNHTVELIYINALLKEWDTYKEAFGQAPLIKEMHLGGGTPTFFSPENLKMLITGILKGVLVPNEPEFSFEGHPNNTTEEHLHVLFQLRFRRVSFGIQDFDPKVQDVINRKQSFAQVEYVTDVARLAGYTSVNFDLIYGLPFQTEASITETINKVILLKPDRIAFYSYAHVPWIKPGQRKFTELDLPDSEMKRSLYEKGRKMFIEAGYTEIGMDHFALPNDVLTIAGRDNKLHRNFMGYTTVQTSILIGLGCSAISDIGTAYAQNIKVVEPYMSAVNENRPQVFTGCNLSETDIIIKTHILNLICRYQTSWEQTELQCKELFDGIENLSELEKDGLVEIFESRMVVTETGKMFIRNICSKLDQYLSKNQFEEVVFSKAV